VEPRKAVRSADAVEGTSTSVRHKARRMRIP
jgi:hypothetical protein